MTPEEHRTATRLCVRACRVAFREVAPNQKDVREEIARRLQEIWEDEGIDLSALEAVSVLADHEDDPDAPAEMVRVYRARQLAKRVSPERAALTKIMELVPPEEDDAEGLAESVREVAGRALGILDECGQAPCPTCKTVRTNGGRVCNDCRRKKR